MNLLPTFFQRAIRVEHAFAPCGCCPDRNIECAKGESLGDDAAHKFQSYHAAKGTAFEHVNRHAWDLARLKYLRHQAEARGCLGTTG